MDKSSSMETSAVVDLEMMDGDESDYEVNFSDSKYNDQQQSYKERKKSGGMMEDIQGEVTKNMTSYMFAAGKERAKKVFNIYGNIDILRPYFDVEPHEVRQRIIHSLVPQRPNADVKQRVHRELYGPLMIVFTMIALLLFQMKMSDHNVQEGTLMGTAFGVCFGYWFGVSSLLWVLSYVCNTHITMLQIMSLLGYSLFGHCVVLFLGTVFHSSHDHAMFYFLWAVFGGLSTLKMVTVLMSRTAGKTQKLIVCGSVAVFHLLFLLYLHFAYHQIVEEFSVAFNKQPAVPNMKVETNPASKLSDNSAGLKIENPVKNDQNIDSAAKNIEAQPGEVLKRSARSVQHLVSPSAHNMTALKEGAKNTVKLVKAAASKGSVLLDKLEKTKVGQKVLDNLDGQDNSDIKL